MPFPRNIAAVHYAPGDSGVIGGFTDERIASKLLDVGVRPGATLNIIRRAPFGTCCYVKIDKQCMALRKQELACIVLK